MANGTQFLVFAIDAGDIKWMAAHDNREDAVAHINDLRPDGTRATENPNDEFTSNDCIEFAFIVESPHFVSFV